MSVWLLEQEAESLLPQSQAESRDRELELIKDFKLSRSLVLPKGHGGNQVFKYQLLWGGISRSNRHSALVVLLYIMGLSFLCCKTVRALHIVLG